MALSNQSTLDTQRGFVHIPGPVPENLRIKAGAPAVRFQLDLVHNTLNIGGFAISAKTPIIRNRVIRARVVTERETGIFITGAENCIFTFDVSMPSINGIKFTKCKNCFLVDSIVRNVGTSNVGGGYGVNMEDCESMTVRNLTAINCRYGLSFTGYAINPLIDGLFASGPNVVAEIDNHGADVQGCTISGAGTCKTFNERWGGEIRDLETDGLVRIARNVEDLAWIAKQIRR